MLNLTKEVEGRSEKKDDSFIRGNGAECKIGCKVKFFTKEMKVEQNSIWGFPRTAKNKRLIQYFSNICKMLLKEMTFIMGLYPVY